MHPSPLPPASGASSRFCTSCGVPAVDGARFCGGCGTPLAAAPAAAPSDDAHQDGAGPLLRHPPAGAAEVEHPTVVLETASAVPLPDVPLPDVPSPEVLPLVADQPAGQDGPLGLVWQPDTEPEVVPDEPEPRVAGRRRRALVAAGAAAAVAVTAAGGVYGVRYLQDGDARAALSASTRAYNGVLQGLASATDATSAAAAASAGSSAAEAVERAVRRLGPVSAPEDVVVRDQLESEKAVLLALAGLAELDDEPLATWAGSHAAVTAALATEADTRSALRRHRAGAAAEVADSGTTLARLTTAVGPALVEDAASEASRVLAALDAATTTAHLRQLGTTSATEHDGVAAAAQPLPAGDGKEVLTGYAQALDALSGLAKVDGESPGPWKTVRAEVATALGTVVAAAGSDGVAVGRDLDEALDSADAVVGAAAAALADWRAKTAAAVAARTSDTEDLADYASSFRSQTKSYEQLRQDLSTFTARVEDVGATYGEAYAFLSQAAADRRSVRDLLVSTPVPSGLDAPHQAVVSAVDRAISAVQSAYDGLEQSQECFVDCTYYRDTPGWQTFLSESDGISKAYGAALGRWDAAVTAQERAVANRPLPAEPVV